MNNKPLLLQPSMHVLLAIVGGLLLGWPVLNITGERGHWAVYSYVFSVWLGLVALLVLVGRTIARSARAAESDPAPPAH
jgi:uncharacterized membrane protein